MGNKTEDADMKILSYIVRYDSGLAPNPFWGQCTLSCCKPVVRRTAEVGDVVVGLTPKTGGHRVVYVMRVSKKMTFAEYWNARAFQKKKPNSQGSELYQVGDNIYRPLLNGNYAQQKSRHTVKDKPRDLSGRHVLASNDFVYFGAEAIELPKKFRRLIVGRGHRKISATASKQDARFVAEFDAWFAEQPRGRHGTPHLWLTKPTCHTCSKPNSKCM